MIKRKKNEPTRLQESEFSLSFQTKSCTTDYNVWRNISDENVEFIDTMIDELTRSHVHEGETARLNEKDVLKLNSKAVSAMLLDSACPRLSFSFGEPEAARSNSVYIVGDLYGRCDILLQIFDKFGSPANRRYVFLGNYVDRGKRSIETICLLLAYKVRYPSNIYLLRGNHECQFISRHYGFYRECAQRFRKCVWQAFIDTFRYLPGCVIIGNTIMCCHSGLWPDPHPDRDLSLDKVVNLLTTGIELPVSLLDNHLLTCLAWSEPRTEATQWQPNPAGLGVWFNEQVVVNFCKRTGINLIVRSNECHELGYELLADGQMLSFNSLPWLIGGCISIGAVAEIKVDKLRRQVGVRMHLVRSMGLRNNAFVTWEKVQFDDSLSPAEFSVADGSFDKRESLTKTNAHGFLLSLD